MVLSETLSETSLCNMALVKMGGKKINNVETGTSVEAITCRLHYEQARDSLLRSHYWRFASARSELTQDSTDPDFEWDNQFKLPDDFLRLKSIYDTTLVDNTRHSFAIEGQRLLTNDNTMEIRYIKKVTDVTEFDPLFIEVLILQLALKLIGSLAGGHPKLQDIIQRELKALMPSVRALDRQETDGKGRADQFTWADVRATRGGRIDSRLGSA